MAANKTRVAVVQLHTKLLEPKVNFDRACEFIRHAASQKAQLVVLPEYHLNGYVPHDPVYIAQTSQYQEYLDGYCKLARELKVCIVPGTIVERHARTSGASFSSENVLKDVHGEFQLYNTAYFISNDGSILGSYRKRNLWHTERPHQSRGQDKHNAINTPVGKIGLLACWDLAFPEAFRELVRDGADIIIVPTCWTLDESDPFGLELNPNFEALFLNSLITARCFENSCAVVFANSGGPSDVHIGLSQVAIPYAGAIGAMKDSSEGVVLADIDLGVLKAAEANYKVREDMMSRDWHYTS